LPALALAAGLAWSASAARADDPEPRWEAGLVAFGVSQQAWPGAAAQVRRAYPLPYAYYRGSVLRVDRETVGLRAMKTPGFELDVGFAGAFGSRAQDIPVRRGMPDLGTLVEFGPRGTWQLGRSASGVRWQFAASSTWTRAAPRAASRSSPSSRPSSPTSRAGR
jgi:hypothetical protein